MACRYLDAIRIFTLAAAMAGPAWAGSLPDADDAREQAEWVQHYDADAGRAVDRETVPVLSAATLAATRSTIDAYVSIVAHGGWGVLQRGAGLRVGARGLDVIALRRRLAVTGDIASGAGEGAVFDAYVEAGVRHFQARHGLGRTGVVTPETEAALNVPAEARLRQLRINAVRLASLSGNLGRRFVMANIPAAEVETVEDGRVHSRHIAGVGKADRPSPVIQAKAVAINFNPYWHIPASIVRKDLIPKMRADPRYLGDNRIHAYDATDREIPPTAIDWSTDEATKYRYREDPGTGNSMGVVRIDIANPFGVYMHDTATKGIFGDDYRFISSGCIRVQSVRDYVAWLLRETPGWNRERIDAAVRSGQRIDARLAEPVPVYWVYVTAWASPDGMVQFRDDVYGKDGTATTGQP